MSKRFLTSCAIGLTAVAALMAATVKGRIVDSQGEPLIGATATLLALPDSTVVTGVMTDADGLYSFKDLTPKRYAIKASMTGMDTEIADFTVADTTKTVELPPLKLYDSSIMLKEVTVKGVKTAVVAKGDTLEFNADSFHTTDNAVVEDLLKKLPGVEVGSDGAITSGGKTVSKILVNGKEVFSDDPKMATKNLTAKMVDKVQVLDRRSEQARLTGVDDGEDETVINLTVKKGMADSWFGNVRGGYGTDKRYTGNIVISRFEAETGNQFSLIGNANNTNNMGFGDMGGGGFGFGGGGGGINATQMLGMNFNVGNEEIFRIGGDVSYNHSKRNSISNSNTIYQYPDRLSYQKSNSTSNNENHNLRANFRIKWEVNEDNTFDFRPSFSYYTRYSDSFSETQMSKEYGLDNVVDWDALDLVNDQRSFNFNHGNSYTASGSMTFVHRFTKQKKGRSLSLRGEYSFTNTKSHGSQLSEIAYYMSEDHQDEDLFRYTDNHSWNNNVSARVTWTEPIIASGHFLEFGYSINSRSNNSDKLVYNLPESLFETDGENHFILPDFGSLPVPGLDYDDALSTKFRNKFLTQTARVSYRYTTKAMNLNAGIEMTPSDSKSRDLINPERNNKNNVLNWAPFFRMRLKFRERSQLNIRYNARTNEPSLTQLQKVPDFTDPMNVKYGNPDLKPTFTQRLNVFFTDFNMDSQRTLTAMINGSYSINDIVSKTTIDASTGKRTSTYANTSGNMSLRGMFMYNQPLRNKNWRVFARLNGNYSSSNGYINDDYNRSGSYNLSPRVGMTFSTELVQISANPSYSWQLSTNTLANQPNRRNQSYGFNSDFTLYLPFGLQFTTDLNYSKTTGLSAGYDSQTWLWNANMQYTIPKSNGLSVFVEAHDLLGDTKNISRNVTAAAITDSRYNNVTRYFMFGLSWQFNSLNRKKAQEKMAEQMGLPMPPPGDNNRRGGQQMGPPPGGFGGGFGGGRHF